MYLGVVKRQKKNYPSKMLNAIEELHFITVISRSQKLYKSVNI